MYATRSFIVLYIQKSLPVASAVTTFAGYATHRTKALPAGVDTGELPASVVNRLTSRHFCQILDEVLLLQSRVLIKVSCHLKEMLSQEDVSFNAF